MSELCIDMQICHFPSGIYSELARKTNTAELTCLWGKRMKPKLSHFETGEMIIHLKGNRLMPKDAVINQII